MVSMAHQPDLRLAPAPRNWEDDQAQLQELEELIQSGVGAEQLALNMCKAKHTVADIFALIKRSA